MKRVLMIAYYFPPLGGIGSLRSLKFASYLPEAGWEPTVVSPANGAYFADATLTFPEDRIVRTPSCEFSRLAKKAMGSRAGDTTPAAVNSFGQRVQEMARRWVYFPDAQIGWYPFALSAARRLLRDQRFDAVFSSSFPITAHLVARALKEALGIPWVCEFRDPWAESLSKGDPRQPRRTRLEDALVRSADSVVVPSPHWAALFREKGARSVSVVTNGYDPRDMETPAPPSVATFTHVGSLYPERQDLHTLLRALASLQNSAPHLSFRLRFVGEIDRSTRAAIISHGLGERLEVTGFISHGRALHAMSGSSALLLLGSQTEDPVLKGWIPAKVFEYLGSGLPIVYLGSLSSDAASLVSQHPSCHLVAAGEVESLRVALLKAASERPIWRDLAQYTRRTLAARLAETLTAATI